MKRQAPPFSVERLAIPIVIVILILLVMSTRIVGLFLAQTRLWGINILAAMDWSCALFLTAPMLLLFHPAVYKLLHGTMDGRGRSERTVYWIIAGVLLLSIVLFPMKTFFYGDGNNIVPEVYKLGQQESYSSEILNNIRSAPIAGAAIVFIARSTPWILHTVGLSMPETSTFPFHILSVVLAIIATLALWWIPSKERRLLLLMIVLGNAGTLLFFGYVEFYTPVYVCTLIYLLLALRALDGGSVWPAVMAFFAACGAHYSTIALLPSLLYLLIHSSRSGPPRWISSKILILGCAVILVVGISVYLISGLWKQDGRIVIPAITMTSGAGDQSYTLLSLAHLSDLLQLPLLLAPASLFYLLLRRIWLRKTDGAGSPPVQFLGLALFFYSVFLVFANAGFGWARDWDLAAPLGLFLSFLSFHLVVRDYPDRRGPVNALALLSMIAVFPWIVGNVSTESSTRRFEDIVELDSESMYADYALSGFETLRKHYLHIGDYLNELRIEKRMIERLGYAEHYRLFLSTVMVETSKNPLVFTPHARWMLQHLSSDAERLRRRGISRDYAITMQGIDSLAAAVVYQSYFQQAHPALMDVVSRIEHRYNLRAAASIVRGMDAFSAEDYDRAEREIGIAARSGFGTGKLAALRCNALLMLGRVSEAESEYRHACTEYPKDSELRFLMGSGYLVLRDPRGKTLLEEALRLSPSDQLRTQIVDLLTQLSTSTAR